MSSTSFLSSIHTLLTTLRTTLVPPDGHRISRLPLVDMLAHNWSLGLIGFGGPAVNYQMLRRIFVAQYQWIDDATYNDMFALCQALPGPGSTKMLYAINMLHYGFWSGVGSFLLWSLPMALTAFGLAVGVDGLDSQLPPPVYALLSGLNAATVGIIALAAVQLANTATTDHLTRILVFLGGTAGMLYNALWYFPVLVVAGGSATLFWDLRVLQRAWRRLRANADHMPREDALSANNFHQLPEPQPGTTSHQLNANHTPPSNHPSSNPQRDTAPPISLRKGILILLSFLATITTIMVLRSLLPHPSLPLHLLANLFLAGTIIVGGGPVVIPLLRTYIVTPGWVSPRDFLIGLAITQAFPGPNFNFAVYLGALAVKGSGVPAVGGAVIGYVAIFLPGLWMHTAFMGLWSRVRKVQGVRAFLRGIHAMAVGLVFTAVYRLFEIGFLDADVQKGGSLSRDPWWVVIVATSFIGGKYYKLSPPLAIILGAAMGLTWYAVVHQ